MTLYRTSTDRLIKPVSAASGDAAARALVKKLLKAGCQPYFQMLEKWLCEGDLDDPFQEFMICQDSVSAGIPHVPSQEHPAFVLKKPPPFADTDSE